MDDPRESFRDQKFILLTSYKKDGSPVETQMWFVLDAGRLFVRTSSHHYKVKRIRRNPLVKVAPCDFTGTATIEPFAARAEQMPQSDADRLGKLFAGKFPLGYYLEVGLLRPFADAFARVGLGHGRGEAIFYEIIPEKVA
jgi:PPOX class probable F420-dependent enzyme